MIHENDDGTTLNTRYPDGRDNAQEGDRVKIVSTAHVGKLGKVLRSDDTGADVLLDDGRVRFYVHGWLRILRKELSHDNQ